MIQGNGVVCAAVLVLATHAEGFQRPSCGEPEEAPGTATGSTSSDERRPELKSTNEATPGPSNASPSTAVVAPIFDHGEGQSESHGDYAFLSEEEALMILKHELSQHGIKLVPGGALKGVDIAPRHQEQLIDDTGQVPLGKPRVVKDNNSSKPLQMTGMDKTRYVAVKFVSRKNYERLGGYFDSQCIFKDRHGRMRGAGGSSYYAKDYKEVAQYISREVARNAQHRWYVGIFYEPVTHVDTAAEPPELDQESSPEWQEAYSRAAAKSKRLLRKQVQEFVKWLDEQRLL